MCCSRVVCVVGSGFAAVFIHTISCWRRHDVLLFFTCALRCDPVAYEMALEQIIADLDDLEERVENLNVDQKTNEDILLNVLKRVDETEKDLRKVRCGGSLRFGLSYAAGLWALVFSHRVARSVSFSDSLRNKSWTNRRFGYKRAALPDGVGHPFTHSYSARLTACVPARPPAVDEAHDYRQRFRGEASQPGWGARPHDNQRGTTGCNSRGLRC